MAKPKEQHQAIAEALNAATGSKAVRGEDLLPPDLAKKYRAAKKKLRSEPIGKKAVQKG